MPILRHANTQGITICSSDAKNHDRTGNYSDLSNKKRYHTKTWAEDVRWICVVKTCVWGPANRICEIHGVYHNPLCYCSMSWLWCNRLRSGIGFVSRANRLALAVIINNQCRLVPAAMHPPHLGRPRLLCALAVMQPVAANPARGLRCHWLWLP